MGATKIAHYSPHLLKKARIADALGHPARLTILQTMRDVPNVRPRDLEPILKLTKNAIHLHIQKLVNAGLVELEFRPNEYKLHFSKRINFNLDEILDA